MSSRSNVAYSIHDRILMLRWRQMLMTAYLLLGLSMIAGSNVERKLSAPHASGKMTNSQPRQPSSVASETYKISGGYGGFEGVDELSDIVMDANAAAAAPRFGMPDAPLRFDRQPTTVGVE